MKSFKKILFALIFLPCVLFFSACGGAIAQLKKEANVDTEGTYIASSKSEFITYIGLIGDDLPENNKTTMSTYRITCKTSIENNEMLNNGIFILGNSISETQFATRTSTTSNGKQMGQADMYFKDGWVYINGKGGGVSIKQKYLLTLNSDIENADDLNDSFQSPKDFISQIIEEESLSVSVAVKGKTKKFKIEANKSNTILGSEMILYLVYENDTLQGLQFTSIDDDLTLEYSISKYTGSIKFPSFKGYVESSSDIEDWIYPFE